MFVGSLTDPHQLVRARTQTYNPVAQTTSVARPDLTGVIRSVWGNEGRLGFYKALPRAKPPVRRSKHMRHVELFLGRWNHGWIIGAVLVDRRCHGGGGASGSVRSG